MNIRMTYKDIIKNSPKGNEKMMWDAVDRVDCLVAKLRKECPDMARDFLKGEYEAMNGKHLNEWLAHEMVSKMWHENSAKVRVEGEVVTPAEAMRLLDGMDAGKQEKMTWDAYVGANAFMHDLANTGLSKDNIMNTARHFWFHDDDIGDSCHKVYWYFEDWIYE